MAVVYEQGESFADLQKKNTIQDESEDVGFFESALAGVATGLWNIPKGFVSLGAEIFDLVGDSNTAKDVEQWFDDVNPFDDEAEARTIGKITTALASIGPLALKGAQLGTRAALLARNALKAKEAILVWTDNALYTMKFVGAPFTFGFEQVGTNCGLIGKNAEIEIDGVAFWMSPNGFFMFDGTVKSLPCSVEDFVYDSLDTTKGQQVYAGINNLFTEVIWYYPSTSSEYNDKYLVFNYGETMKGGVWYIGTEARTTWIDATVYPNPIATKYNSSASGTFPVVVGESGLGQTTLFEHEVGTDQVNPDGSTTAVTSFVKSFDFDLQSRQRSATGQATGPTIAGDVFLAVRRFIPDFKDQLGDVNVELNFKLYPSSATTTNGPFTVSPTTTKIDTRARGRQASLKITSSALNTKWRYGTYRADVQPDGMR